MEEGSVKRIVQIMERRICKVTTGRGAGRGEGEARNRVAIRVMQGEHGEAAELTR